MAKTNWQDPQTSEVRSTDISGLQEAVSKLEDSIGMETVAETDIPLTEVYISEEDRYRIFQAPAGKRNWVSSPTPVIKRNGVVIDSGFVIDYGGGAIALSVNDAEENTYTADATYITPLATSVKTHLAETTTLALNTLQPTNKTNKAMMTFVCDDGGNEDWRTIMPMLEDRGFGGSFAIPPGLDGMYRQDAQLMREWQGKGMEFVSHGYNHINLTTLNESQIEFELTESQKWLRDNGLNGYDILVYPQGGNNALVRKLARKYYRAAIGTLPNNGINKYPLKMFDIARVSLGSCFQTAGGHNLDPRFPSDSSTYEYYKARVDYAVEHGQWLIFMMHPDNANHDAIQNQHLSDLLDYIQNLDVEVVTYSQGLDILGNVADVGDYHYEDTEEYFALSSTGEVRSSTLEKPKPNKVPNLISNHNFDIGRHLGFYSSNVPELSISLDTDEVKNGKHSIKLERLADTPRHVIYNVPNFEKYKGKTLVHGAWVKCPHTNQKEFRLGLQDGVSFKLSKPVPNDNEWHWVTVKQKVSDSATVFQLNIGRVLNSDRASTGDILYVDSVYLYEDTVYPTLDKTIDFITTSLDTNDNGTKGDIAYDVNSDTLYICTEEDTWKSIALNNQTTVTTTTRTLDFDTINSGSVVDLEALVGIKESDSITVSPADTLSVPNGLIWSTFNKNNRVYIRMANISSTSKTVPVGDWNINIHSKV